MLKKAGTYGLSILLVLSMVLNVTRSVWASDVEAGTGGEGWTSAPTGETSEPSDPSQPVDTSDPTDPSEPVDPTDPTDPSELVDPTDPTNPSEPVGPTDPTNPTEPVDPSDPTDPSEPVDPTDPTNPTEPVDPTDPTNPSEPVDPTDPTNPTEPVDPTDPTDPTEPVDPSDPTNPTEPVDPTDPTNPTEPVDPTDPTNPSEPVDPTDPSEPGEERYTVTVQVTAQVYLPDSQMPQTIEAEAVCLSLPGDATAEEILQAVAESGAEDGALESWQPLYAISGEHYTRTTSQVPETLTEDLRYEITYTPMAMEVIAQWDQALTQLPYGYPLTLPVHENPDMAYTYTVNEEVYFQGQVVQILGKTEMTRREIPMPVLLEVEILGSDGEVKAARKAYVEAAGTDAFTQEDVLLLQAQYEAMAEQLDLDTLHYTTVDSLPQAGDALEKHLTITFTPRVYTLVLDGIQAEPITFPFDNPRVELPVSGKLEMTYFYTLDGEQVEGGVYTFTTGQLDTLFPEGSLTVPVEVRQWAVVVTAQAPVYRGESLADALEAAGEEATLWIFAPVALERDVVLRQSVTITGAEYITANACSMTLGEGCAVLSDFALAQLTAPAFYAVRSTPVEGGFLYELEVQAPVLHQEPEIKTGGAIVGSLANPQAGLLLLDVPVGGIAPETLKELVVFTADHAQRVELEVDTGGKTLATTGSRLTVKAENPVSQEIAQVSYTLVIMGDVNQNGQTDVGDAVLILSRMMEGENGLDGNQRQAADMNRNSLMDVGDAVLVLRKQFTWNDGSYEPVI